MAKLTTQGRLKPILNGKPKDPFQFKLAGAGGGGCGGGLRLLFGRCPVRRSCGGVFGGSKGRVWASFVDKYGHFSDEEEDLGEDELDEFEEDDLDCFRGLVLDISYRPVNVVCWRRAICLEFMEKADVLEYYDQTVNSPSGSFYIPAVLRVPHLLQVVKRRRVKRNLSRKNIFYRDNFTCQYCSTHESLTIDHVIPMTRGGEWTWENLVAACVRCNSRKGSKTLEEANMKLIKVPKAPKDYDILAIPLTSSAIKMLRMRKGMPEEWRQYLANSKSSAEP